MKWLLDTVTVSALRRTSRLEQNVTRWLGSQNPYDTYLSAMTVFEIERGVLRLERKDSKAGAELREWSDAIRDSFAGRILPVDEHVATRAADMHIPDRQPEWDVLIAATADVHNLTVVTRNVKDFAPLGVRLLNPWDA